MDSRPIQYRLLTGFDDPLIGAQAWNDLVRSGSTDVLFLTFEYQKCWWEVFGRGQLLLIAAFRHEQLLAIAPLFTDGAMIYFVGSGGSDYLDFIGLMNGELLRGMMRLAGEQVSGLLGFRFYHLPENSDTQDLLASVASYNELELYEEQSWPCPRLEVSRCPEHALDATRKKSLLRHQAWFDGSGEIKVEHMHEAVAISPHLDEFFDQHIRRWAATDYPSLFLDPDQQLFYQRLCEALTPNGWLRFTRIIHQGRSIAYHFGFNYCGSFLWYKPSFEITLAKHGPGEVLIRHLILRAIEEEAHTFDFGLGDEAFKQRFATNSIRVNDYGLYPKNEKTHAA